MKRGAGALFLGVTMSACMAAEPAQVVVDVTTTNSAAAEPTVLADADLDTVTAAGVLVNVNSVVAALGGRARTLTNADTFAVVGKRFDLGVGLTFGHGYACCGEDADVKVGSAVLGVGEIVREGTRGLKSDDGISAQGLAAGYVVALSFHEPLLKLGELRPALADVRSKLRGTGAQ